MKHLVKVLFASSLLLSSISQARIEGRFLGQNYFVTLVSNNPDGSVDSTPQSIYRAMAMDPVSGALGFTKSLRLPEKEMQFGCTLKGDGNYQCVFMLSNSSNTQISFNGASGKYSGESAQKIFQQFKNISAEGITYNDQSGQLTIRIQPTTFDFKFTNR